MAIDSTLFAVDLPAGTYTAGDVFPLSVVYDPASVRSGRGTAKLKRIFSGLLASGNLVFRIHVKNSDWIDEAVNLTGFLDNTTCMDVHSGMCQFGNDADLTPNSAWQVYAECVEGATTTAANSAFALIDIDYPQVSAITDPDKLQGTPTSIVFDMPAVSINANGSMTTATWKTVNVDYLKAGYQYCLQEISARVTSTNAQGFIALSNAAGMGGLSRVIPVNNTTSAIRATVEYASKLVKGPMDVGVFLFAATATTSNVVMVHDYVKRAI